MRQKGRGTVPGKTETAWAKGWSNSKEANQGKHFWVCELRARARRSMGTWVFIIKAGHGNIPA